MLAHEKLIVYQKSIALVVWAGPLIDSISAKLAAKDQLDRASTSVPLNIAEGNGKFSMKDRSRFLQMALGSALECAACLDVLVARKVLRNDDVLAGKKLLEEIVSMLFALLDRFDCRLAEDSPNYGDEEEDDEGEGEKT